MEIYNPYELFEIKGESIRLKDNSGGLERICSENKEADFFIIKDDLHEFKFCMEKNKFLHEKNEIGLSNVPGIPASLLPIRSYYYLIDKETGIKTQNSVFSVEEIPISYELSCYGVFGYLTLNKDIKHSHSKKPGYCEFLEFLASSLTDNHISVIPTEYLSKGIFTGLTFHHLRTLKRNLFLFKEGNTFKYISHQYKILEPNLINLDLKYLLETENAVLKTLGKYRDGCLVKYPYKRFIFKDKLYKETLILEHKFNELIEHCASNILLEREEKRLREIIFADTWN